MKKFLSGVYGYLILIIVAGVTLFFLFSNLTKKSFYPETGNFKVKGISKTVNVFKDDFGVSHVSAENEADMYFTMGYMHAQDRLWQMDISRRVAEGKLSEIFGQDALEYDKLFRTIGINRIVKQLYTQISPKSKEILQQYANGVNYFMGTHSQKLPLEFDILNYKPYEWKPEHSLMIVRLMGWELNISWYTDFLFGEIVKKFGYEKAKEFFPNYPEDKPFIIGDREKVIEPADTIKKTAPKIIPDDKNKPKKKTADASIENGYKNLVDLGSSFYKTTIDAKNFLGIEGTHIGSNSWVVGGKKTESKKPILANDPHLSLSTPAKWYEIHLYNKQNNSNVSGFSLPGCPLIVIGHNDIISWGITNLMNDDSDFYILNRDSSDNKKYVYNNTSLPVDSINESIKIKDINDEYDLTVFETKLGPVISNLSSAGFSSKLKFTSASNQIVTFRWTGFEMSDEIQSFYDLNSAKNFDQFKNSFRTYNLPALNFTYADTNGNIGYQAAGKVPIRKNLTDENMAFYPSDGEIEWTGFIPFNELPSSYNPKEDYIITANNKPEKNYKHYISNLYEPYYRAQRIEDLLIQRNNFTADEIKLIQRDVYSLQAKEFCKYLFDAYANVKTVDKQELYFLDQLKKWDYELKYVSPLASIYSQFEIELYRNIYREKLGDELFKNYLFVKNIPVRNTSKLLAENKSWLFESLSRDFLLRKSFVDAINALKRKFGTDDMSKWAWGNIHEVLLKHPLGSVPALSNVLNIGPFEIGGSGTTIACAEYSFSNALEKGSFDVFLGSSMRMIVDLGDQKKYFTIIPTGQSGQPLHENFSDQARRWLNGDYKVVITDFNKMKEAGYKTITLIPE
ncbi:MAG: penicillin acylase family protein [Ignavibacteria bacterium]|nr:penicillin acylase family protein [Ignavibacteria bacterium]